MNKTEISFEEYIDYSKKIQNYYYLFYKVWNLGKPVFTEQIKTAAVTFDEFGENCNFLFNPNFWDKSSDAERLFIICHECLHVLLNHGKRIISIKNSIDMEVANVALDVVVNELLVSKFGFNRKDISYEKDLCWLNTVFRDQKDVLKNQNFEYYYNKIKKEKIDLVGVNLLDEHEGFCNSSNVNNLEQFLSKLGEETSQEILKDFSNNFKNYFNYENLEGDIQSNDIQTGTNAGNNWTIIKLNNVKKKKKWETVIKNWSKKFLKTNDKDYEQWARTNRRLTGFSLDLILPSELEIEDKQEGKINVWFFQDTSGSCASFAERFFKAAKSLPTERFDIQLYCFDTYVYETSLESGKLYGFGGTSFNIISKYINENTISKKLKYPEAIFVITDGDGDNVDIPERYRKKWYWFLSSSHKYYIPKGCNIYNLSDFE
jgi:predicted metal-dependent peptidase